MFYCSVLMLDFFFCEEKALLETWNQSIYCMSFRNYLQYVCVHHILCPYIKCKNLFKRLASSLPPYGQRALIGILIYFVSERPERKPLGGQRPPSGLTRHCFPSSATIYLTDSSSHSKTI